MINAQYEIHKIDNPQLPFIFHGLYDEVYASHCEPNWHENVEILVCHKGSGLLMLDGRQYNFVPGDICIANSYCLHATTQEKGLRYSVLIVGKKFFQENGIPISEICFHEHIRSDEVMEAFLQVVNAYRVYRPEDPYCVADIRYAVLGMLRLLCRKYLASNTPSQLNTSREWVKQAIAYINLHYAEPIHLQNIADHIGISKYYLSRTFRKYTGATIVDTVNRTRCSEAKRLIESGVSVSEAAFRCGYENLSYFTRSFRNHLGEKPSHFRKDTDSESIP